MAGSWKLEKQTRIEKDGLTIIKSVFNITTDDYTKKSWKAYIKTYKTEEGAGTHNLTEYTGTENQHNFSKGKTYYYGDLFINTLQSIR